MSAPALTLPAELYVFVNQASFTTRHNFALTGKFVSAAFGAAFQDQIPAGTVALWSPGGAAPRQEAEIRAAYESRW